MQVWIFAKRGKRSQAGKFLTSWRRSHSMFYNCSPIKTLFTLAPLQLDSSDDIANQTWFVL